MPNCIKDLFSGRLYGHLNVDEGPTGERYRYINGYAERMIFDLEKRRLRNALLGILDFTM